MKKVLLFIICSVIIFSIYSCGDGKKQSKGKLKVIATTTIISDAIKNIAKDKVELFQPLCGPGVDPHSYTATTRDIKNLSSSDIIFYSGLRLEEQLAAILEKMQDRAIAVTADIPKSKLLTWETGGKRIGFDPHIWNNPDLWSMAVVKIAGILAEKDSANKEFYIKNSKDYIKQIRESADFIKKQIELIPESQRVLITTHDAFRYFSAYYGFKNMSLLGISTQNEASVQKIQNLADYIAKHGIKSIFVETIVNEKSLKALQEAVRARGAEVKVAHRPLYSDAFGTEAPEDSYIGMVKYNIVVISEGLR